MLHYHNENVFEEKKEKHNTIKTTEREEKNMGKDHKKDDKSKYARAKRVWTIIVQMKGTSERKQAKSDVNEK